MLFVGNDNLYAQALNPNDPKTGKATRSSCSRVSHRGFLVRHFRCPSPGFWPRELAARRWHSDSLFTREKPIRAPPRRPTEQHRRAQTVAR